MLPILRSDDGRSLPQTFRGGQVTSNEIAGLTREDALAWYEKYYAPNNATLIIAGAAGPGWVPILGWALIPIGIALIVWIRLIQRPHDRDER